MNNPIYSWQIKVFQDHVLVTFRREKNRRKLQCVLLTHNPLDCKAVHYKTMLASLFHAILKQKVEIEVYRSQHGYVEITAWKRADPYCNKLMLWKNKRWYTLETLQGLVDVTALRIIWNNRRI